MHDITTRRDAFDTMAEVILEAREVSGEDRGENVDIKVSYATFGKHYRQEFRPYDDRTVKANVLRRLREDNPDFVASDDYDWIEFDYDGMRFFVCREDEYRERLDTQIDMMVEDTEYEVATELEKEHWWNPYVKFDAEAFRRDMVLSGDADSMLAYYDGTVHEVHTINGWFKAWRID